MQQRKLGTHSLHGSVSAKHACNGVQSQVGTHKSVESARGNVDLPAGMTTVTHLQLQEQRQLTHTHKLAMSCGPGCAFRMCQQHGNMRMKCANSLTVLRLSAEY